MTELPDVVPLFPLPNAVFFPYTVLPLHIFEPRYRAMVKDVEAGLEKARGVIDDGLAMAKLNALVKMTNS